MTSGGCNRKIDDADREALLALYLAHGQLAAEARARALGVGPNYAKKLACERGFRPIEVPTGSLRQGDAGHPETARKPLWPRSKNRKLHNYKRRQHRKKAAAFARAEGRSPSCAN